MHVLSLILLNDLFHDQLHLIFLLFIFLQLHLDFPHNNNLNNSMSIITIITFIPLPKLS